MTIAHFIPEIWSAVYADTVEKELVYSAFFNSNYEGEIREAGATVRIPFLGDDVTIKDYTRNTDIDAPQILTGSTQSLVVDQAKYFNMYVDNLDRVQARPELMAEGIRKVTLKVNDEIDQYLAGVIAPSSETPDMTLALGSVTAGQAGGRIIEGLTNLRTQMKEANFPNATPSIVLPPKAINEILLFFQGLGGTDKTSASGFAFSATDTASTGGVIGNLGGFRILESNNVPSSTSGSGQSRIRTYRCTAGTDQSATWAQQLTTLEAYKPERRIGDAAKGLHVYGAKKYRNVANDNNYVFTLSLALADAV